MQFLRGTVNALMDVMEPEHPDLLGVCLSGAGPSIVAFAERNFDKVERVLSRSYESLGIPFRVRTLAVHQNPMQAKPAQAQDAPKPVVVS